MYIDTYDKQYGLRTQGLHNQQQNLGSYLMLAVDSTPIIIWDS